MICNERYQLTNVRSKDIPKIQWRLTKPHDEKMFTPEGLKELPNNSIKKLYN